MFANKYDLWVFLTTSVPTMTEGTEDYDDKNFFHKPHGFLLSCMLCILIALIFSAYHMSLFGNQPQLRIKKVCEIYLLYKCLER